MKGRCFTLARMNIELELHLELKLHLELELFRNMVLSGLLTVALLGVLGYLYLSRSGGDDDDEGGGGQKQQSASEADDDGSPLSDARRIMDKYK
ncbi:hypothetical protein DUNSADRAFT_2331 [Dunaliella salina]|uniref:Uncharacterized protein n=1 Tax=Dunaliella salina TaxID=3046 RepID=A0ABQ7GVR6_DUNSA|nr:hypothetical protein DUNSADRAFT_2331 [Dunaliella salina]|eukprot:KAF5838706.1 hypothetical protein DUNSADRAFT_2331 [Dunaliella salina]